MNNPFHNDLRTHSVLVYITRKNFTTPPVQGQMHATVRTWNAGTLVGL